MAQEPLRRLLVLLHKLPEHRAGSHTHPSSDPHEVPAKNVAREQRHVPAVHLRHGNFGLVHARGRHHVELPAAAGEVAEVADIDPGDELGGGEVSLVDGVMDQLVLGMLAARVLGDDGVGVVLGVLGVLEEGADLLHLLEGPQLRAVDSYDAGLVGQVLACLQEHVLHLPIEGRRS